MQDVVCAMEDVWTQTDSSMSMAWVCKELSRPWMVDWIHTDDPMSMAYSYAGRCVCHGRRLDSDRFFHINGMGMQGAEQAEEG